MSIENHKAEAAPMPESSEHLLSGLFTPGDKQIGSVSESASLSELLAKNEQLIMDARAHSERLATAAVLTVSTLPDAYQKSFFDGMPAGGIYDVIRRQMAGSDLQNN